MTKKIKPAPALNRERTMGNIYSSEGTDGKSPRFYQDGHYFTGSGEYLYSDEGVKAFSKPIEKPAATPDSAPAVTEPEEVDALLEAPIADELLLLDRETLVAMVKDQNGPVLTGEDSSKMMVAWLVKQQLVNVEDSASDSLIPADDSPAE